MLLLMSLELALKDKPALMFSRSFTSVSEPKACAAPAFGTSKAEMQSEQIQVVQQWSTINVE